MLPLWTSKYVTARGKVLRRVSAVGDVAQGFPDRLPGWRRAAEALPRRPTPVKHRGALSHYDVAEALRKVRVGKAWDGIKLAFEFLVLTATRSAEGPAGDVEGGRPWSRWCGRSRKSG